MMNNISFNEYNNTQGLAKDFAKEVAHLLQEAIIKKQKASLLVSGGNTPKLFFQELCKSQIDWQKVTIGLVDERWIDACNEDSNTYLVQKYLLKQKASNAQFIPLFEENSSCFSSSVICSTKYEKYFKNADVLILGMGTDGHTASLFPKSKELKMAMDVNNHQFCMAINPITAPYERMSLSLNAILQSNNIFLHIEGLEKRAVYEKALEDFSSYPISKVLSNAPTLKVYYGCS